ncbi:heavy metal-binding protein HIP-like [Mercenaria mercenaria]|uniref:heavy metal-binding protein HIP-like n=1 Tax=Mercenaria mercenaria TaxID=6596 RepID=UPI00234F0B75|nr:heavy metal-binding protein HIP-like [Mercenaria mercenaria]
MAGYFVGLLCVLLFVSHSCAVNTEADVTLHERLRRLEESIEQQDVINKQQAETIRQLELASQRQQETILKQEKTNHLQAKRIQLQENEIHRIKHTLKTFCRTQKSKTETRNDSNGKKSKATARNVEITNLVPPVQRTSRQYERIVFSSYLDHNVQNLGIDHPIVYNRIIINEGSAYNEHSGMFTCPVDGIYGFYFSVSTQDVHQIVAKLVVDSVNEVDGVSDTMHDNHEAQGGNFVFVSLTKGQQVWVANYRWTYHSMQETDIYRFSTFSGFLLN